MANIPGVKISMYQVATDGSTLIGASIQRNLTEYLGTEVLQQTAHLIAERYVAEHYDDFAPLLDKDTLLGLVHQRVSERLAVKSAEREKQRSQGVCPDCGQNPKANLAHPACLGPEWAESMRERGIDFATGHRNNCPTK